MNRKQQAEYIAQQGKEAIDYLDHLSSEVEKVRKYNEAQINAKQGRVFAQADREFDEMCKRHGVQRVR